MATSWPSSVAPRRCRRRDPSCCSGSTSAPRPARPRSSTRAGSSSPTARSPTPWEPVADGSRARRRHAAWRRGRRGARGARPARPTAKLTGIGVTSVAETGMLLDASGAVLHRPDAWHDLRGAAEAQALARELPHFNTAHRPARQRAVLAGQARSTSGPRGAARWLNVGEWIGTAGPPARSPSCRSRRRPRPARSRARGALRRRPSPGPACPATPLGELVLAGARAGRSDGAALPGDRGRRVLRGWPRPPRRRRRRGCDRARRRARLVRDRRGARARGPAAGHRRAPAQHRRPA